MVNVQSFNETLETVKPQIDIMNGRQNLHQTLNPTIPWSTVRTSQN